MEEENTVGCEEDYRDPYDVVDVQFGDIYGLEYTKEQRQALDNGETVRIDGLTLTATGEKFSMCVRKAYVQELLYHGLYTGTTLKRWDEFEYSFLDKDREAYLKEMVKGRDDIRQKPLPGQTGEEENEDYTYPADFYSDIDNEPRPEPVTEYIWPPFTDLDACGGTNA